MKDVTTAVETQGNINTQGTAMTIHSGAIGKLMSMFSNQYSNAALAVVREYFCNGDDARIAAGSERPTEVWLPTELQTVLVIRDYGVGLDKEGLVHTFATYGLSTKDDTNDQTGGFGIGSKAAFTLGQQFVVTGYKDGHQTTALFALDAKGIGQVTIQFEGPTQEPNGVKVEVGVPDVDTMNEAAHEFFLTVPKGRALVDGKEPEHLFDTVEHSRFNDEVVLVKDGEGEIRVQMGPVVYPVTRAILLAVAKRLDGLPSQAVAEAMANWSSADTVLMEVGMGEVSIAPSREDLRDTESTINRLSAVVQGISDYIHTDIQAKINAAPSRFLALLTLREALEDLKGFKVRKSAFTYNGLEKAFKNEVEVKHPTFFLTTRSYRSSAQIVGREDAHTVDFERADKTLVVTGVAPDEVSKVSRYAKRFLGNREDIKWIVVTEETSGAVEWFEWGTEHGAPTMTLEEYRLALRAMRDSDPARRTEPSYSTGWRCGQASRDLDDRDLLSDIVSWGKPIVIQHGHTYISDQEAYEILDATYTCVVLLGTQSEAALVNRIEADGTVEVFTGNYREAVAAKVKADVPEPTEDERVAYGAATWAREHRNSWGAPWAVSLRNNLGKEKFASIKHPLVHEMVDAYDLAHILAEDLTEDRRKALARLSQWCGVEFSEVEYEFPEASIRSVFPLLEDVNWHRVRQSEVYQEDVVAYVNGKA